VPAQYSTGWNGPIIQAQPSTVAPRLAVAMSVLYSPEVRLPGARAIIDQKNVNCCVSCALATCLEVLYPAYEQLSPLFHYYETVLRFQGRAPSVSDSLEVDQGWSTLASTGICSLTLHQVPYDLSGMSQAPSSEAEADARNRTMPFLVDRYLSPYQSISLELDPVNSMKRALAARRPILAGIQLTANYGAVKLLDPGPPTGARHAVAILGYSDAEASFVVQDSRGQGWGQGGQWWLPYSVIVSPSSILFQAFAVGYPGSREGSP
jgi:hypothetical protein